MFLLSNTPIDADTLKMNLQDERAGALVTFEGWVRNHNDGHDVFLLEYEAMSTLAMKEAEQIIAEAKNKYAIYNAHCVHRVGALQVGELAVWIGVTSAHRKAAFEACQYIIDEIKSRLPIWKKEHYKNGTAGWVNCQCAHSVELHTTEAEYYRRQTVLPEMWPSGQQKLKQSRVLVVGAGGLGCPALSYLAAAGVGTLGICDGDVVDGSNLHRQVLYAHTDIGKPKAALAKERLQSLNPFIAFHVHNEHVSNANVEQLLAQYDVILDCSDNFDTKFLLNDSAIKYGKTLVQASIYQWEGQILIHTANGEGQCLRCLWPEQPDNNCVGNCAQVGILGAAVGALGSMQALEAIKLLLDIDTPLKTHLLILNLLTLESRQVKTLSNPNCGVCSQSQLATTNA